MNIVHFFLGTVHLELFGCKQRAKFVAGVMWINLQNVGLFPFRCVNEDIAREVEEE